MNEQTVRPKAQQTTETDEAAAAEEESPATQQVKSATLAVSPEEAQALILAAYKGSIHMVLRSREDVEEFVDLSGTTDWALMGLPPPVPAEEEPEDESQQMMAGWPPGYMQPPAGNGAGPAAVTPVQPSQPAQPAAPTIEVIRGRERTVVTTDQ